MPKVSQTCLTNMTKADKDLNAWKLNWVLGREFYRARQDAFSAAYWEGIAWANYPNPNFTDDNADFSAFRTQVKPGFESNTPGWSNDTCALDLRDLACVAYWLASSTEAVRSTFVALMQQYDASIPYLQATCPQEIASLPEYQPGFDFNAPPSQIPPVVPGGDNPPPPHPGDSFPPDQLPPGTTPGTIPDTTPPVPGGVNPVKADDTTTEKKTNWWLWGSLGALVVGGAAFIGFMRPSEVVYDQPAPNPRRRKGTVR